MTTTHPTTPNDDKPKTRVITLTGRPPVKINEANWPVIATGSVSRYDGEHEFQANRRTKALIRVRQHADGRAIVYGTYDYSSNWQDERDVSERAGSLLAAGEDVVRAIHSVAATLGTLTGQPDVMGECERECIADMPPEEI